MINLIEIYKTSNKALLLHKARTILTMLGVIIGVFAVVSLVSLGVGVQNYVTDQFESIGSNVLLVAPGNAGFAEDPANTFGRLKFDEKNIDDIRKYANQYISVVSPSIRFSGTVKYKTNSYYSSILAPNHQVTELFDLDIQEGRFFNENEERNKSRVVILGPNVVNELFPNTNPIGKRIDIEDYSYEVIGYTKKKGQDFDDNVYIPYTRAMEDFDIKNFTGIVAKAKSKDTVDLAQKELKYALLRTLNKDDFQIISASDILSSIQNILSILTTAIGAIAAISLLVGGIGIMNIMLVSVTERTKEIGLRKAVGATSTDIASQFVIESVLISLGGGIIGVAFGWLAAFMVRSFADVRAEVPLWAIALAFGFSMLVGMIFGTYPAYKASKKDPVDALRYE